MRFSLKIVRLLLILFLLAIHQARATSSNDVEFSWLSARLFVPDVDNPVGVDYANNLDKAYPVVLYLHGCMGINKDALNWARLIGSIGFVVVLPDSMARTGRVPNCDPKLKKGNGAFPAARIYRQQEISYALNKILAADWAQKKNIFLMGHSEGGWAAAQSKHDEFAGVIISGATCTNRNNLANDGIFAPANMPVLAVASIDDEWYANKPSIKGRCADKAADRSLFRQVDLLGSTHSTFGSSIARDAVKNFLIDYRSHFHN